MAVKYDIKTKALLICIIILINACTDDDELPTVTTLPITEITWAYAITGGEVIDAGGSPVIARGVCVSENGNLPPTLDDYGTWFTVDSSGMGSFSSKIGVKWHGAAYNLTSTHYVRAYATNSAGTAYGEVLSFYPGDKPLSDNSIEIKSIEPSSNSALINYKYYSQIMYTVREFGICYSTSSNATVEGDYIIISDIDEGDNTVTITNLIPNTIYYIRSYDKNSSGVYYSSEENFITNNK